MPQMYLRELPCCGLYTVMVNKQPTDCCGLAFGGSPGPLETHLADHPHLQRLQSQPARQGQRAPACFTGEPRAGSLQGWEADKLRAGGGAGSEAVTQCFPFPHDRLLEMLTANEPNWESWMAAEV